ncbi:MAG TPA: MjaI family restriction endonuclease [Balneolales bacterium]|nr:MjaI family restriction endonuclease [Balneolales bacterium]
MSTKVKIKYEEIQDIVVGEVPDYPKYTTQILNLANQNSQGTRPKVVGQMSDLIQEFDGRTVEEWIDWYEKRHPNARDKASDKVEDMVIKLKDAIKKIDREMIETWVKDLVLYKTFIGLRFQEAILKKVADIKKTTYRLANKEEESQGIDGYIGYIPVSIKPHTYRSKASLAEEITVQFIYYEKKKSGITIEFNF